MFKKLLTSAFVFLYMLPALILAQGSLTGTVTTESDGESLPGANILLVELNRGASADAAGEYTVSDIPAGTYTVRATFVGFETFVTEVTIGSGETTLDIEMSVSNVGLDDIVVTGYSTTTKEKSNISSISISAEKIENRPNPSVAQRLTGQVAGLNITTSNGQPGGNSTINLRGVSSINGNTEPLFIMDGTPIDEDVLRSLNPNEIESVDVLKDAAATAIYGNRGANGVVVIRTKQGSFNSGFQVEYSGQVITSDIQQNDYNLMNAQQQLELEKSVGRGRGATLTDQEIANAESTDWVEFFLDPSVSQSHTLSISNGKENLAYHTSIGFAENDGLVKKSGLKRYNLRNNVTGRSENQKFNFRLNTSINYSDSEEPNFVGAGAINRNTLLGAFQSVPYINPDDYTDGRALLSPLSFANTPLFIMDRLNTFTRTEAELKLIGNFDGSFEIMDGLTVNGNFGAEYTEEDLLRVEGPESFNALLFAEPGNTTPGFHIETSTQTFNYNALVSLNYTTEINNLHTITAGAYGETFQARFDQLFVRQNGLNPKTFSVGDGAGFVSDNAANDFFSNPVGATRRDAGLLSYFGSVDYDYDTRYGFSATIRRDASYRFVDSNRWGTFYSFGGRWNIHNETFLENSIIDAFDVLKLRGSFGKTGNQDIVSVAGQQAPFAAPDLTLDLFASGSGYAGANSLFLSQIGNRSLKWETVFQTNIGLDMEMFESRFRASIDVYKRKTEDLFQNRPVSAVNSVTNLRANIGDLQNKGIDWDLEYDILRERDHGVNVTLGFLGNYNKQEILDIPTPENQVINGLTGLREGGIINEYFVLRYAGVNPDNGELLFLDKDGNLTESPDPDTDRVWLDKNVFPDAQGSITFDVDYKGAFLQTQWQYTVGVYRFDFDYASFVSSNNIGQFRHSTDILDSWTPDNRDASLPSLTASNRGLSGSSDRFLRDADFVRLRFVSLGYNIPAKYLQKLNLRGITLYANGENLLTFTKWRGFDPETLNGTGSRLFPNPKTLTFGIDLKF